MTFRPALSVASSSSRHSRWTGTPLTETQWTALARDLQVALKCVAPDWTDLNTHDPGVTVLEVLAYALTALQYRRSTLDERTRLLARRVAERAGALATSGPDNDADDCEAGLQRVNFMQGMVLGVDDFRAKQLRAQALEPA